MNNIPNHVAIIMDGNGRWAQEKGKKRSEGHKEGGKTLEKLALYAKKLGIKVLSVYAFSTDNFKRSKEEVDFLMDLVIHYFNNKLNKVCDEGIKIIFSGRREPLRDDVLEAMDKIVEKTKNNTNCILNICINYGGQEEIVDASIKVANDLRIGKIKENDLNRETFLKYLYQDLPPIDLLIRTGKEHRLSNFMLYQSFYAEIYFVDTYFPDFLENDFDIAIEYYISRNRTFGNVKTN
ncbi:MAG: di-trans,poly-cis-decaprenylcistransferase [Firmicutes bacterium]|nr:di-trans,poly-cis-decaprenylcistransferase [Bacillota bacterium]